MTTAFLTHGLKDVIIKRFMAYRDLGEKALAQLEEKDLHQKNRPADNSIAIIIHHLHGNMLSRFTDFLNSDGEKMWRNRDAEFVETTWDKPALMTSWNEGWDCVLQTLGDLKQADWEKTVTIRGEAHSVLDAVLRQLAHYAYHVGQIVFIAKSVKGDQWQTLSVPMGQSEEFNRKMEAKRR